MRGVEKGLFRAPVDLTSNYRFLTIIRGAALCARETAVDESTKETADRVAAYDYGGP